MTPEDRLETLGLRLPRLVAPAGNLLGYKRCQGLIHVSGQLPLDDGELRLAGKVGASLTHEQAKDAAHLAALNALAQLSAATAGDLSKVEDVLQVSGFVNCTPDFQDLAFVVNGASDLLVTVLGEAGRHARFAVGVAALPRGAAVEIALTAKLRE